MLTASDTSAQLVQLRDPETLGVLDDHHGRVGTSIPTSIDRRRDEDLRLPARERGHRRLLLRGVHLTVQQRQPKALELAASEAPELLLGGTRLDPRRVPSAVAPSSGSLTSGQTRMPA